MRDGTQHKTETVDPVEKFDVPGKTQTCNLRIMSARNIDSLLTIFKQETFGIFRIRLVESAC